MEKNNIISLFDIFRENLKEDIWTNFFFLSLCGNLWYDIEEDTLYINDNISLISQQLSNYRNYHFFKNDNQFSYYNFINNEFGYISEYIKNTEKYKKFIVLPINEENNKYIKSLNRNNKIKKILR